MTLRLALLLAVAAGALCAAPPAHAQLGGALGRARRAAERAVDRTADRTTERASEATTETAANVASPERAAVDAAARALDEAWDTHYAAFNDPQVGGFDYMYVNGDHLLTQGADWLAAIEAVEALYDEIHPHMQVLAEHLADDASISNGLHRLGLDRDGGHAYDSFLRVMGEVAAFRQAVAADAVDRARSRMEIIRANEDVTDVQLRSAREVEERLVMAQRFDPNNAELNALRAEAASFEGEVRDQMMAQIEAARWPGHGAGPTNLAPAILDYFRGHREWGGRGDVEVLAVAVRGGWQPAKHNLIGQVIQWRLPIVVASVTPDWRELGAARMFELSVLSTEGNPSRQGPPFDGYWVGDSGFIRLDRVPGP